MDYKTPEQIQAENIVIANRLSENFGEAILNTVKDDYARYDLDQITQHIMIAEEHGLVFDVSRGPEVLGFITPEQVIERFSKKENFRDFFELVEPSVAIERLQHKISENQNHFSTFSPDIQAVRADVFEQNRVHLQKMIDDISRFSKKHALKAETHTEISI